MTSLFEEFMQAVREDRLISLATLLTGPEVGRKALIWPDGRVQGSLGDGAMDAVVSQRARSAMAAQRSERFTVETQAGPVDVFVDVHAPSPKLIIVGAVHIAIPLVTFAKTLGFRTVVVDARSAFATPERFAHADELIARWPADALAEMDLNESTYVVTLTHDEKLDNPALVEALRHPVRYIGALGSRKTHGKRVAALKAEGVTDDEIARIHAPIGLDLGGRSPEEIALAIMAEIVAVRNGVEVTGPVASPG
jgi:xanthine dehydrogenase accessory factor